jgi:hypothetical protein
VLTGNTQFEYELKKLIRSELTQFRNELSTKGVISDYPAYMFAIGRIWSLERFLEYYCDEVTSLINKRE